MIDTNIFISVALFPNGRVAEALMKALMPPYEPVVCDYIVDELHRKFREKFPDRMVELEAFLFTALQTIEIVSTPVEQIEEELKIRDVKDRPILRAALDAGADVFLTGDKDFLESLVTDPRIISVNDFLKR
ncbi:MAG: putative toxin-antitoxin system toxin component, PIN family [Bilifractor sp.]|nr:putative toxin-antitoxin system toxin component, PIN family [Lachnospiraceae bacterium]MDY2838606.1 putative toxin-antitoxin system toxin component, PIN family [Bilifractor sp.]